MLVWYGQATRCHNIQGAAFLCRGGSFLSRLARPVPLTPKALEFCFNSGSACMFNYRTRRCRETRIMVTLLDHYRPLLSIVR